MTEKELQEHIKINVWEESEDKTIHGYGAAVVCAALYKKLYGDFPKLGLSGFQADAADSVVNEMPEPSMPDPSVPAAVQILTKAFKDDPDYRRTWVANIAMAFQDEYSRRRVGDTNLIHSVSNKAAENFLDLLCKD